MMCFAAVSRTDELGTMNVLTMEEYELLGDAKYRAYISHVEKALKNFEYTSEWADLISALGKLNKVSIHMYIFGLGFIKYGF